MMEVPNNYVHFALEDFVRKSLINLPQHNSRSASAIHVCSCDGRSL